MQPVPDPYQLLGVPRGASMVQIKAAHRSLAKRYHPDAPKGDTHRFLAIQDAYLLLTDPIRRREWDARHAPGPVRAGHGPARGRRGASGRWTREEPEMGTRRGPRPAHRPADGPGAAGGSRSAEATRAPGSTDDADTRPGSWTWTTSGRDPGARTHTWSAEGVPWWDEAPGRTASGESPGRGTARGEPSAAKPASSVPPGDPPETRPTSPGTSPASGGANESDVYSRSSGAAWSSAARRYFREADSDLPHRGVFRRQGTQYVTGARARQAAESEARPTQDPITRARPGASPARQAFDHEPPQTPLRPTASTGSPRERPVPERAAPGRQALGGAAPRGAAPGVTSRDVPRRIAEVTLAWVPLAAGVAFGVPLSAGCEVGGSGCSGLVMPAQALLAAALLGALIVFPALARVAALAATGALAVAIPLVVAAALLGLLPPAPPIAAGAVMVIAAGYVVGGCIGAFGIVRGQEKRPRDPGARMGSG